MKYIKSTVSVQIRFSETDAMGIVWHGNYLKYFEDAREYLCREFGLTHLELYNNGYFTPIVKQEIEHKMPIHYGDNISISVYLEKNDAAKIIFKYIITNSDNNKIIAKGLTIQVFMNSVTRVLELIKPTCYTEWEEKQNWINS